MVSELPKLTFLFQNLPPYALSGLFFATFISHKGRQQPRNDGRVAVKLHLLRCADLGAFITHIVSHLDPIQISCMFCLVLYGMIQCVMVWFGKSWFCIV